MEDVLKANQTCPSIAFKIVPTAPESWRALITRLPIPTQELIYDNLSPFTRPSSQIAFYSTVVTSEDSYPSEGRPSWDDLMYVNRFSSISALRQLQSFGVDVPVV